MRKKSGEKEEETNFQNKKKTFGFFSPLQIVTNICLIG